jgi:hypothetical protein
MNPGSRIDFWSVLFPKNQNKQDYKSKATLLCAWPRSQKNAEKGMSLVWCRPIISKRDRVMGFQLSRF